MQVFQTPAAPPNQGRMALLMMGWIWKSRNAETKIVNPKRSIYFQLVIAWKTGSALSPVNT